MREEEGDGDYTMAISILLQRTHLSSMFFPILVNTFICSALENLPINLYKFNTHT